MKTICSTICLILSLQLAHAQSVTGTWVGKLTQESGGVEEAYYFEMQLVEKEGKVVGVSHIGVSKDSEFKGMLEVRGSIEGTAFSFEEYNIPAAEGELPKRASFCEKKATLKLANNTLAGAWTGRINSYGNCSPGKISIQKKQSEKPELPAFIGAKLADNDTVMVDSLQVKSKTEVAETKAESVSFGDTELKAGQIVELSNITFEPTKHQLKDPAAAEEVYQFLLKNPTVRIELAGHTDKNPLETHPSYKKIAKQHLALSKRRVEAVAKYLTGRGIDKKRIVTKAYGGSQPLVQKNSPKNRRVEMKILSVE